MSVSSGAFIGFGCAFDAGTVFPWDAEPHCGDIESWWRALHGFEELHQLYNAQGEYAEGFSANDPRIAEFYEHRNAWHAKNPLPVALLQYGELDVATEEEMQALIVPGVGCDCSDDSDPEIFDPAETFVLTQEQRDSFSFFLSQFRIESRYAPSWLLCCYS